MDEKEEDKKPDLNILYLGPDLNFWEKLRTRISDTYKDKKLEFNNEIINDDFNPYFKFKEIIDSEIQILFLDFSLQLEKALLLAKLLRTENTGKLISTVGLHNRLITPEIFSRVLLSGIRINHFKGEELGSIIYQAITFFDPVLAKDEKYALVRGEFPGQIIQDIQVSYFDNHCIEIETNSPLQEEDIIPITRNTSENKILKKDFTVTEVRDYDMYYNNRFAAKLSTEVENEAELPSMIRNWIIKPSDKELLKNPQSPKNLKVLMIDRTLALFANGQTNFEKLPYNVNIQTRLMKQQFQVKRSRPHLIVYAIDKEVNNEKAFSNLIQTIESLEGYDPFIVIFNCKVSSENIRESFNYSQILTYGSEVKLEVIDKLASALKAKLPEIPKERVYIPHNAPSAIIKLTRDIFIIGLDESTIYFKCDRTIPLYTVLQMNHPVDMIITIVPIPDGSEFKSQRNSYKGLINYLDEINKAKLRKHITDLMDTDKKLKEEEERKQQEVLKREYQVKKAQEAQAKEEDEDNEDKAS